MQSQRIPKDMNLPDLLDQFLPNLLKDGMPFCPKPIPILQNWCAVDHYDKGQEFCLFVSVLVIVTVFVFLNF